MLAQVVIATSLVISFIDIRDHRIHNSHLLIFAIPLSISSHRISLIEILGLVLLALTVSLSFRIGGGDFKLFSLLIAAQGGLIASAAYFYLFVISASLSLVLFLSIARNFRASIPLAPAILAPFLHLYLAI